MYIANFLLSVMTELYHLSLYLPRFTSLENFVEVVVGKADY